VTDGVTVPTGTTHVWEPSTAVFSLEIIGNAAVRVTSMNRAGQVIQDIEMVVNRQTNIVAAAGAEFVAVTCLGTVPDPLLRLVPGFGAVTFAVASRGAAPAVGWQVGNVVPQVGASSMLTRGAALVLRKAHIPVVNKQKTTQAMAELSRALLDQSGTETWLPKSIGVVMILLDQQDATAADNGDLGIACDGAVLATPPVLGAGGRRRALLYDILSRDDKSDHITVSAASQAGWALSGVIGLPGRAVEWAARIHGSVPPHLVPDGPLTSWGEVRVRLANPPGGVL
jgi:hypothetical protein